MPELPEVEYARRVLDAVLDREIRSVDDTDEWVCRPHRPGDIARALVGGRLTQACRRGKTLWCETVDARGEPGPRLGIHLGMGGRLIVTGLNGDLAGGDPEKPDRSPRKAEWDRFTVDFAGGVRLRLFDKRRLARVRLDPDVTGLGPDALAISREEFRDRTGWGQAPVKARLLDQSVVAGVGNLLADETLWQARVNPATPAAELSEPDLDRLYDAMTTAVRTALDRGGVHNGELAPHRSVGSRCPRCGTPLAHGTVAGRSTWWCPKEQEAPTRSGSGG